MTDPDHDTDANVMTTRRVLLAAAGLLAVVEGSLLQQLPAPARTGPWLVAGSVLWVAGVGLLAGALWRPLRAAYRRAGRNTERRVAGVLGALTLLTSLTVTAGLLGATRTRDEAHAHASAGAVDWTALGAADLEVAAVFGALVRGSLADALAELERAAATDSSILRNGHELTHALGRFALQRTGDVGVIAECREIFSSGCYHGVIEAHLETAHHIDASRLDDICRPARAAGGPGGEYECVHGLGHGLTGVNGHDLDATLPYCDDLPGELPEWCYRGVFMEVINRAVGSSAGGSANHAHDHAASAIRVRPDDPFYPCNEVDGKYRAACWVYQSFIIMRLNGFDFEETLRTCDGAPDGMAAACYESFGLQIAGLFQQDDRWILDKCALGRAELEVHCIAGAAQTLTGADWSSERALGFCRSAPASSQDPCFRRVGEFLRFQYDDAASIREVCARVSEPHAAACRGGARLAAG